MFYAFRTLDTCITWISPARASSALRRNAPLFLRPSHQSKQRELKVGQVEPTQRLFQVPRETMGYPT